MKYLIFLLLYGCATGGGIPVDETFKKDVYMEINGKVGEGMMVVEKSKSFKVALKFGAKIELIKIRSCHQEHEFKKKGFFGKRNHKFTLKRNPKENVGYCPLHIGVFDINGRHQWSFVDTRNETLEAFLECNGGSSFEKGVSNCQSRTDLVQWVTFKSSVKALSPTDCDIEKLSGTEYSFYMPNGLCYFIFYDPISREYHRLNTFGYRDIMLDSVESSNQFSN